MNERQWNSIAVVVAVCATFLFTANSKAGNVEQDKHSYDKGGQWTQHYIEMVPPVSIQDPMLELLGQADGPLNYTYEDAVKLSGHSCGAVAGAWVITKKALEELYPDETPVRGNIRIYTPGAEDQWFIGVYGKVMTYLTGAAVYSGFDGAEFGEAYNRRDLLLYTPETTQTPPPQMVWLFQRLDTQTEVQINYNLMLIQPPVTPERIAMGAKVARDEATPEEEEEWITYWNDRARFVFENADTLDGFLTVVGD